MRPFRSSGFGNQQIRVPLRADRDGFLGRECPNPECEGYFKITPGNDIADPAPCHCPYCGHTGDPNTFFTKEQIEYAKSMAMQQLTDSILSQFRALEFDHPPPRTWPRVRYEPEGQTGTADSDQELSGEDPRN